VVYVCVVYVCVVVDDCVAVVLSSLSHHILSLLSHITGTGWLRLSGSIKL